MEVKNQVRELIAGNKIKDALDVFHRWAVAQNDGQLQNSLILIQGKFNRLKQQENLGIIQFSESLREQAIINNSILELLSQIKETGASPTGAVPDADDSRKVILFLASNPSETSKLQLEKEFTRIFNGIQEGSKDLKLVAEWAVTPGHLQQAILKHRPNIIHFAGHGASEKQGSGNDRDIVFEGGHSSGLLLQDANGRPQLVRTSALANLFETMKELDGLDIEVVILNACHQDEQAKAIAQHVPYVIGTTDAIDDNAAIEFSTGFYRGLSDRHGDVNFAFRLARNSVMLQGLDDGMAPVMYSNGEKNY
jgi:hypothetical protein